MEAQLAFTGAELWMPVSKGFHSYHETVRVHGPSPSWEVPRAAWALHREEICRGYVPDNLPTAWVEEASEETLAQSPGIHVDYPYLESRLGSLGTPRRIPPSAWLKRPSPCATTRSRSTSGRSWAPSRGRVRVSGPSSAGLLQGRRMPGAARVGPVPGLPTGAGGQPGPDFQPGP